VCCCGDTSDVCRVNPEALGQVKNTAVAVFKLGALLKLNNKKKSSNKIPATSPRLKVQ
jgi:hypothetical protein